MHVDWMCREFIRLKQYCRSAQVELRLPFKLFGLTSFSLFFASETCCQLFMFTYFFCLSNETKIKLKIFSLIECHRMKLVTLVFILTLASVIAQNKEVSRGKSSPTSKGQQRKGEDDVRSKFVKWKVRWAIFYRVY